MPNLPMVPNSSCTIRDSKSPIQAVTRHGIISVVVQRDRYISSTQLTMTRPIRARDDEIAHETQRMEMLIRERAQLFISVALIWTIWWYQNSTKLDASAETWRAEAGDAMLNPVGSVYL